MTVKAMTIADWFLQRAREDDVRDVSNMKLNKLVYFAQAHTLGSTGRPAFSDVVYAWEHGPVVTDVYHAFKQFGNGPIRDDEDHDVDLDPATEEVLEFVWRTYGRRSASRLRDISHADAPYKEHYEKDVANIEIPVAEVRDFYHSRVSPQRRFTSTFCDFVDEVDAKALEDSDTEEEVARAVEYILR